MTHATTAELADLAGGRIDTGARARLETHLASCAPCAAELAVLERLILVMRTDRTPDPVASVVARAVSFFVPARPAPLRARVTAWLQGLEEVAARLVFDSLREPSFAAARGSLLSRRLRFEAPGLELDLQVEQENSRLRLTGQVIDTQERAARAVAGSRFLVMARDVTLAAGETDAIGEFTAQVEDRPGLVILIAAGGRALSFSVPAPGAGSDRAVPDDE